MSAAQTERQYLIDWEKCVNYVWDNQGDSFTEQLLSFIVAFCGLRQRTGYVEFIDSTVTMLIKMGFAEVVK